ncbi:OLC1v1013505C1 [Oldenlandia corymbosa var. corymbosa]|uniref:OLC1v1013505C1 n=1 Tax=Oldenlandia corymbosa var. corymbosa TaxID=529605 RepID=A0AAV1DYE4_OLDCO|nr:OLC1v1013505C1 [Oldenlandia corymbosa var. corymbosa]
MKHHLQVATLIVLLFLGVKSDPNTGITTEDCDPNTISKRDPYSYAVIQALNEVLSATPYATGFDYTTSVTSDGSNYDFAAFSHGTCETNLTQVDCATCIRAAYDDVSALCNGHVAGTIGMVDCSIYFGPV